MLLGLQDVQKQIDEAKQSKAPPIEDLWNNIYLDPLVSTCYQQCVQSFCPYDGLTNGCIGRVFLTSVFLLSRVPR